MISKNNKKIIIFTFAVILILILVQFKLKNHQQNVNQNINANTKENNNLISVNVIAIKKQKIELYVDLPGRVNSYKISEVRPQISGIIKNIYFKQGSHVKKGQKLYQIDSEIHLSAFQSAKSNLKALTLKRNRYKKLLKEEAISKQEFDENEALWQQAKSEASKAKKNLDYTMVLAPISGYIGKSNYTEGALLTENQPSPLATITQLDPIYVDLQQASKDNIQINNQSQIPVLISIPESNYSNSGILKFSEFFVDEATDSVRLRAIFPNKDKKLLPGMFVNAKIALNSFDAITVFQRAAFRTPDGKLAVWAVNNSDNTVSIKTIKAEKIYNDSWIVEEGLDEGELIVYEGFQKISDGMKINPNLIEVENPTAVNK